MNPKKICIITGSRAEYGLLYWLMKEISSDAALQLQLIATGTHLSPEFGLTYKNIEADGFRIDEKLEILLSSDTSIGMAKSLGLAIISFAEAFQRLRPDILVLLGDRYEILAAAQTAVFFHIPIAHIAGGEITEGAIDEVFRHSITKMAHIHFVATEIYRNRVIQLGEKPSHVFNVGSTGIDYIKRVNLLSRQELEEELNFKLGEHYFLLNYHPPTLDKNTASAIDELTSALDHYSEVPLIITGSNADMGGRKINYMLEDYARNNPNRVCFAISLGQLNYLSIMKHCSLVIGNSSSAIIEAPFFQKAVVNIGNRQTGRLKASCIINCQARQEEIIDAIDFALSSQFQKQLVHVQSHYGEGNSAVNIKNILKKTDPGRLCKKTFNDISFNILINEQAYNNVDFK